MEFESANDLLRSVMDEGNVAQGRAIKSIFTTRNHIFITGRAGSGKSTFMRRIYPFLESCAIVAPTGIAAINAGGSTIHSYFSFNLDPYIPEVKNKRLWNHEESRLTFDKIEMIRSLDTLIIDEISMVRADLLDRIGDILRKVRRSKEPFGGVRLIMIGDLSQLPPIVNDDIYFNYYDSRYFFSSKSLLAAGYEVHYFDKTYRQADQTFINILDNIRYKCLKKEDIDVLNSRVLVPGEDVSYINLVPTNVKASSINCEKLDKLEGEVYSFDAISVGTPPTQAPCEQNLILKIGAQVMITRNSPTGSYVNGSVGTVVMFKYPLDKAAIDKLKAENFGSLPPGKENVDKKGIVVKLADSKRNVTIYPVTWYNVKYVDMGGFIGRTEIGSITQFPMKLGWAISVHKSQGLSLDNAYIDTSRSFESGQVYTAISRCRSLDGLYLMNKLKEKDILVDDVIAEYYSEMKENNFVFKPIPIGKVMEYNRANKKVNKSLELDFDKYNL